MNLLALSRSVRFERFEPQAQKQGAELELRPRNTARSLCCRAYWPRCFVGLAACMCFILKLAAPLYKLMRTNSNPIRNDAKMPSIGGAGAKITKRQQLRMSLHSSARSSGATFQDTCSGKRTLLGPHSIRIHQDKDARSQERKAIERAPLSNLCTVLVSKHCLRARRSVCTCGKQQAASNDTRGGGKNASCVRAHRVATECHSLGCPFLPAI